MKLSKNFRELMTTKNENYFRVGQFFKCESLDNEIHILQLVEANAYLFGLIDTKSGNRWIGFMNGEYKAIYKDRYPMIDKTLVYALAGKLKSIKPISLKNAFTYLLKQEMK